MVVPLCRGQERPQAHYNLPRQSLDTSLRAVAKASGYEILFASGDVAGRQAPTLVGNLGVRDALETLLMGSGLVAEISKETIIIRGRSETPGALTDPSARIGDIIVTGTHIRGAQPTSPVIASSRQEIARRGVTDLGSYARSIPQNFSGGQNPGVISSVQEGSENFNSSSTLNLRGLGPDATLTLVNGHRVAYDSVVQGVDISAIPLVAIDRVEIVADGSSALYGSDAVGGVANIILRRDYDGVLTTARLGAATDGGDVQQQYSLVAGTRWKDGGVMVAGDFNRSTAIRAGQRAITGKLDDSTTLYPKLKQKSAVLAGHQQLASGLLFELDGQYSERTSSTALAFLTTGDFRTNGTSGDRTVTSYSITPRLRVELVHGWNLSLRGTHGASDSDARTITSLGGQLFSRNRISYENQLDAVEADAEGPLFDLPGGEARLALGGGYRAISLDANIQATRNGTTRTVLDYTADQDVIFGYGELSLPLIGPSNRMPLVQKLQLTGAVRYDHYQRLGGTATPKIGLVYTPFPDLELKTTWGKSFKAPTLAQQNKVLEGNLLPANYFIPEAPDNRPILLLTGAIPGLKPERATTWTATLSFTPRFIDGLRLEASYFHTRYRDRVVEPAGAGDQVFGSDIYRELILYNPTLQQVNGAITNLPLGLTNQTGDAFDPANVGAIVDNRLQNAARQFLQGVDLSADYAMALGSNNRLLWNATASYLESNQQLSPGQPTLQRAGTIFDPPHWRGRGSVTWERGNVTLTGVASYIGGTQDDRYAPTVRVGSFTSVDAVAQIKTVETSGPLANIGATLAILNFFNEKPALIRNASAAAPPYDATNYPVVGRVVSLTLSKAW